MAAPSKFVSAAQSGALARLPKNPNRKQKQDEAERDAEMVKKARVEVKSAETENGALSYASSGCARLDLFFSGMVRGAPADKVATLLERSWDEDALEAVKILMNGRDCRDGKGEKEVVLQGLMWLRRNKPRTYVMNLRRFLNLGYYKDLLKLASVVYAERLPLLGKREALELELVAEDLKEDMTRVEVFRAAQALAGISVSDEAEEAAPAAAAAAPAAAAPMADEAEAEAEAKEKPKDEKPAKRKGPLRPSLSLAAKWAPTEGCAFDRQAGLAGRLASMLFPDCKDRHKQYRKALSLLREHLRVTERLMCLGRWAEIDFGSVPSRAHNLLKKAFAKHEEQRYAKYLEALKSGKEKIKSVGVHPHELVTQCMGREAVPETVELQWKDLLARVLKSGRFSGALAVVDVSGSMSGIPMAVAIALGIITAEMSQGHFHRNMITFHSEPSWFELKDGPLSQQVREVMAMPWGCNTDLQKVFQLILTSACNARIPPEEMPRTLFIFSDMQFDQACPQNAKTNIDEMRSKFQRAGYAMPRVVFWNLRGDTHDMPVRVDENGVALMSGFSAHLLKVLLEEGEVNPLSILRMTISKYEAEVDDGEI